MFEKALEGSGVYYWITGCRSLSSQACLKSQEPETLVQLMPA